MSAAITAPELKILKEGAVARMIAERDPLAFALFLGAGASVSSGVILANKMIEEWRQLAYRDAGETEVEFNAWCEKHRGEWYEREDEYSCLFELVYEHAGARQRYIEGKIKNAFPSWGYLYLANIIQHGRFNIVFTTNFDDLINEALALFLRYNAIVCGVDSEVATINLTSQRAKIVKLHGDYLFGSFMKNTKRELEELTTNMARKFEEFASEIGLVVIGYAGNDQSIMGVLEKALANTEHFPHGIYWGIRKEADISRRARELALKFPERFRFFFLRDFDSFMARLHDLCGSGTGAEAKPLELPQTVVAPYQALAEKYEELVAAAEQDSSETIRRHGEELKKELHRPWARTNAAEFDLLQAQIALEHRDYKTALKLIEPYMATHPQSADGFTAWGNALRIRAEEEGSKQLEEEAVAKWREAIRIDSKSLPPRHNLGRYYATNQQATAGIAVMEELLQLTPNDVGVRRNLVQLYGTAGRYQDAETQLTWLLTREPTNPDLHAMRGTLLEQRGMIPEAIEAFRHAVQLSPRNPWLRASLAAGFGQTNRLPEAAAEMETAIELDPNNLNFRIRVSMFYMGQQQPARALTHLQRAVAIEPNSAEAHGWLCDALCGMGEITSAHDAGETAARLSPRDSRIRMTAGSCAQRLQNFELAETHYKAAFEISPHVPQVALALAGLYRMQNRMHELTALLAHLQRTNPQLAQMIHMQLSGMPQPYPNVVPQPQNDWLT